MNLYVSKFVKAFYIKNFKFEYKLVLSYIIVFFYSYMNKINSLSLIFFFFQKYLYRSLFKYIGHFNFQTVKFIILFG